jgi:carbamoyltransferase
MYNKNQNIWIMPNPGDAGNSLGAAAIGYGDKLNWQGPFLGSNIEGDYPVNSACEALMNGNIIGVASGRAEFGPRALGNRSLLADPRGGEIKDRVNDIKKRQKFRPFAPAILEEHVHEYFTMPGGITESPYMQAVAICRKPQEFPAIIHADGTSRVQTVTQKEAPGFYNLIKKFYDQTGCPMLLNTSLNIKGEPLVNTRQHADVFEQKHKVRVYS